MLLYLGKRSLNCFWRTLLTNFWSRMLFNIVLYLAILTFFYSSVTDESFVDETRIWRKYKISILVSMMSLFATTLSMPLLLNFLKYQGFYTTEIDYLGCIRQNLKEFFVLNALQHRSLFGLSNLFRFERH